MSGICGVWRIDGGDADLGPILPRLETRGPEAIRQWRGDGVALGHTLLATTPEAAVERLPLTDAASGCTITADARLDNREELIAALELNPDSPPIGDGELILRAYLKWGDRCPNHLLGDFAFAIWDPRGPRLFGARDHMGMRQLNYCHLPGHIFAFANDSEALAAHPAIPPRINQARIADFLDDLEGADFTSTLYAHIRRLPPAHVLVVDGSGLATHRYWRLTPGPALTLDRDEDYEAAFLTVFTEAVRCRLRSKGPAGSMLSGGMDSGSIVAVAAQLLADRGDGPLPTFSAIGPDPDSCPETAAIGVALGLPGIAPATVDHRRLDDLLQALWRLATATGEPFDEHLTMVRAVYLLARNSGVKVLLDGVAGDVVLSSGNRVAAQMRRLRFRSAWRDSRGEEAYWKIANYRFRAFAGGLWVAFVPNAIRRARRILAWRMADSAIGRPGVIDRDFARRADLRGRRAIARSFTSQGDLGEAEARAEAIAHPQLAAARERYDRTAAAVGIEVRDPFMDIRVIQFCLSLPQDQLQRCGWPKHLLRRAMKGRLPDSLRWRHGKEHLGWAFTSRLFDAFPQWSDRLHAAWTALRPYVRSSAHRARPRSDARERQFELFILACWLDRQRPQNH